MLKKVLVIVPIALFLLVFFIFFSTASAQEEPDAAGGAKKVEYTLPYPGILPNNSLYPLKKIRDTVLIFLTRDNVKKAETILMIGDKKIQMARMLSEQRNWSLAGKTAIEAEDDLGKIIPIIKSAKKQGSGPPERLVKKLQNGSDKHHEVLLILEKQAPQNAKSLFIQAIKKNETFRQDFSSL